MSGPISQSYEGLSDDPPPFPPRWAYPYLSDDEYERQKRSSGGITAGQLQEIAILLSRTAWCRHWLHWNHDQRDPWLMAVSCLDSDGKSLKEAIEARGFTAVRHGQLIIYTIPRLDETGKPYGTNS